MRSTGEYSDEYSFQASLATRSASVSCALLGNPKLLILVEPTEGIQPSIVKEIARTLTRLKGERGKLAHEARRGEVDAARIQAFLTI